MKLPISDRLLCCAAQVPQGARVADIGADHGYLGIELLRTGRAAFVHASELREGPLKRAMANALRYGVAERMRFSRADGLAAIDPATMAAEGIRRGGRDPEKLRYYETALREVREMRDTYENRP